MTIQREGTRPCMTAGGMSKRRYGKPGAKKAIRQLRAKGAVGVEAYRCSECNGWHVGHPPKAVAR